jgi:hypothetical protein
MGGIGKTLVASWLVRQPDVREKFDTIVWATLGQTPSTDNVQSLLLQQLTGARFTGVESPEERAQQLQHAMRQENLLLVLDDCW